MEFRASGQENASRYNSICAGLAKGSGVPNRTKVGKVTRSQVREIAELKAPDLNSATVDAAERMVMGTARSMGIEVAD